MTKLLFVCTGNICRSPTAEAVFRHIVQERGLAQRFSWDSAGTHRYHIGEAPDARTVRTAAQAGIRMDDLRARALRAEDFAEFDLLLAMDNGHLQQMQRLAPADAKHKVQLYLPYAAYAAAQEVPDPYYGEQKDFDLVLRMAQDATELLLRKLGA
jgi:protein-tyrosine phosphatase